MYRTKLELDGYAVDIAADGEAAFRLAAHNPPDIVFLDIGLPHMDGLAVLARLRAHDQTRSLPVVILFMFVQRYVVQGLTMGSVKG